VSQFECGKADGYFVGSYMMAEEITLCPNAPHAKVPVNALSAEGLASFRIPRTTLGVPHVTVLARALPATAPGRPEMMTGFSMPKGPKGEKRPA
jgi:hypothetical protein